MEKEGLKLHMWSKKLWNTEEEKNSQYKGKTDQIQHQNNVNRQIPDASRTLKKIYQTLRIKQSFFLHY